MKIHLSRIPDLGLALRLEEPLAGWRRLVEQSGPQPGAMSAQVTLKNRQGFVEIAGSLQAQVEVACHRCLERALVAVDEPVHVHLAPIASWTGAPAEGDAAPHLALGGDERRLAAGDLDVSFYEGEEIDLTQALEDELMLATPATLCDEDDQGRCRRCGKTLEELLPRQDADSAAHPFAALRERLAPPDKDHSRGK